MLMIPGAIHPPLLFSSSRLLLPPLHHPASLDLSFLLSPILVSSDIPLRPPAGRRRRSRGRV